MEECKWAKLPKEIVETIGLYLDSAGWAAMRGTCKNFVHACAGVTLLEIDLERDAHRWMMVLTCVARLFPRLSSVALLCGSRITSQIFAERMAALSITSIQLQELELRFLYLANPRVGTWLEDLSGLTELRQLRLLRLAGGATPPPAFFEQLSGLRQLRELELLPGVYGQIAGFDMDLAHADAGDGQPTGNMGVGDAHLEAIGHLTQLRQITLRVCPHDTTPAGLAALTRHGLLAHLEHLALYDAELPCASLAEHLGAASRLTSLQFGLNSVSGELGAITRLKSLRDVSLDTAFLPSLQDLVVEASRCRLPPKGPGAISGLCLLDQTIGGPEQLACLSSFSALAELVLVNPLVPGQQQQQHAGGGGGGAGDAAADADAAHHHHHHHHGHGGAAGGAAASASAPIDLGVLASLADLRLLQIDLGGRPPTLDGGGQPLQPLPLRLGPASVPQLAAAWSRLETLDLSGFGPDLLPEEALAGLGAFTSLRSLSIMHPDGMPHGWMQAADDPDLDPGLPQPIPGLGPGPGAAAAAAAGGGGGADGAGGGAGGSQQQGGQGQGQQQRSLPWWRLPRGLVSLCLSHMDISGQGVSQCSLGLPRDDAGGIAQDAAAAASSSSSRGSGGGSSGRGSKRASSSSGGPAASGCGAPCGCCLVPASAGGGAGGGGAGQQQQLLLSGLGLGLSLFQSRGSPLRPLSKRRRQTQQRTEHSEAADDAERAAAAAAAAAAADPAAAPASSSAAAAGEACGAAAGGGEEDAALQKQVEVLCSCATRLPAHFGQLQALWLEHVALPPTFLPRVLPPLAASLESLALLHVSGTAPEDMASLAGLTGLTSLRLIPSDHDVGGLEPLLGMKHLKKLNVRLTHLQPSDVGLLPRLRSLFCLSLAAPCVGSNALLPGFPSAVRLARVEEVVRDALPYCDLELQPEPDMAAVQ